MCQQNGWTKGKQILFPFLQELSNDNWHFYSTKTGGEQPLSGSRYEGKSLCCQLRFHG